MHVCVRHINSRLREDTRSPSTPEGIELQDKSLCPGFQKHISFSSLCLSQACKSFLIFAQRRPKHYECTKRSNMTRGSVSRSVCAVCVEGKGGASDPTAE